MDKKTSEKDYLEPDEQNKSTIEKIIDIFKQNWLAFLCALIIAIITIIVVPIIYSLDKPSEQNNGTNLSWDIDGQTIINDTHFVNNISNDTIGIISSLLFDVDGNLYLLDKTKNRLLKYDFIHDSLTLIFGQSDGSNGTDLNSLSSPNDFTNSTTNKSIFYIVDTFNNRILSYNIEQAQAQSILGTGSSVTTELNHPMSITMDNNSTLYIADYGNNQIISFNIITNVPQVIIPNNINSDRHSYLLTPISIKYSSKPSSLVIAQEMGFNVVRWMLNSNTNVWTLIAGSASSELNGTSRTLFNRLCSINIDSRDDTYVNDCNNQRIQFYNGDMTKGKTIAGVIGARGNNSYIFNNPTAITFDADLNLYVADPNNIRIQKFKQLH